MLEKYFKLRENATTPGVEVMAGLATFLTSVYVLFVLPLILSDTGMPRDALFTATALSVIAGSLLMAFFANMPLILAPGMGVTAYFAYSVVKGQGYTWQEGLTGVLVAGIIFLVLGALGVRKILLEGFPEPLKHAMTVSLGLMVAGIGLKNSGIVLFREGFIGLGDVTRGSAMLALIGVFVTGVLMSLRLRAAILLGIVITTIVGCFTGVTNYSSLAETGALSLPPSIGPIAVRFVFDPARLLTMDFFAVVFALLVLDIFDSLGTFIGVFNHFSPDVRKSYEARIPRALMCDAGATVTGAFFGVSTVTTYVESSTGIQAGGRTGLTALAIAGLMAVALFASPLFLMVPAAATAPALVVVGMLMMNCAGQVSWLDPSEGLPAILMIMTTALTWSISDGLMFGWTAFFLFKLFTGKFSRLPLTVTVVALFFLFRLFTL